jgi:ketosteroid isomerase-like protein
MRKMSYAFILIATLATPATAVAADENLKQVVEKLAAAYADNIAKQNPAGIAALFANGGILVVNTGTITDITKYYEGAFKAGINHDDITIDQVQPLGTDALVATGEYHLTGKNESGAPIDIVGFWTGVDVREGGTWKVRMLTALPKAPPPAPKN